jgi:DNA-binding PadR family transcriptional regulator
MNEQTHTPHSQARPSSLLHLAKPTSYILLSLAPGKKHGYAILKDVEALSDGRVRLSTSALYSALNRLLDQGLIERVPNDAEADAEPTLPYKAYVLSEIGWRALATATDCAQAPATVALSHLGQERV